MLQVDSESHFALENATNRPERLGGLVAGGLIDANHLTSRARALNFEVCSANLNTFEVVLGQRFEIVDHEIPAEPVDDVSEVFSRVVPFLDLIHQPLD